MPEFTQDWFSGNITNWEAWIPQDVKHCLEIGSFEGMSACWLLENRPESRLTLVDPCTLQPGYKEEWYGYWDRLEINLKPYADEGRAHLYKLTSQDFWSSITQIASYDLIYVDGDHEFEAALFDIKAAWMFLRKGGLLILDDYAHPRFGVAQAWRRFMFDHALFDFPGEVISRPEDFQLAVRKTG